MKRIVLFVTIITVGLFSHVFAQDDGWTELSPMQVPRSEFAAAVIDDQIYTLGGFGTNQFDSAGPRVLEVYDVEADRWTLLSEFPETGRHHLMMAAYDGELYVFGGTHISYSAEVDSRVVYVYNPTDEEWRTVAPMTGRRTAGAAVVLEDMIYIVGGTGTPIHDMPLLRYDPVNDSWEELAAQPLVRDHVAAVAYDGQIWAIGGRELGREDFQSVAIYDPETDTWTEGPALNVGRAGFGAAVIKDRIYVAGGELLAGCASFPCEEADVESTVEMYDPEVGEWAIVTETPVALHGLPIVAVDGKLYVAGGSIVPAGIDNPGRTFVYEP